jgi:hypothetical protein
MHNKMLLRNNNAYKYAEKKTSNMFFDKLKLLTSYFLTIIIILQKMQNVIVFGTLIEKKIIYSDLHVAIYI